MDIPGNRQFVPIFLGVQGRMEDRVPVVGPSAWRPFMKTRVKPRPNSDSHQPDSDNQPTPLGHSRNTSSRNFLGLLPPGPDPVRSGTLLGTFGSTPLNCLPPTSQSLGRVFSPAKRIAGYRAPLTPHLARSIRYLTYSSWRCNGLVIACVF